MYTYIYTCVYLCPAQSYADNCPMTSEPPTPTRAPDNQFRQM